MTLRRAGRLASLVAAGGGAGGSGMLVLLMFIPVASAGDGSWSPWSMLHTQCTKPCGSGTTQRIRTCNKPEATDNGQMCRPDGFTSSLGSFYELQHFPCNVKTCFDGIWSEPTNCSVECGRGIRHRYAMCGDNKLCEGNHAKSKEEPCNTWNKTSCPDPCIKVRNDKTCPEMADCRDDSDEVDPKPTCVCTMGNVMGKDGKCARPKPTQPTMRPVPSLPPAQKLVVTVVSKTASTILIICVSICLGVFLFLRIFSLDRVIQMNMEIALLTAHVLLVFPPQLTEAETMCRIVSILIHFFFTACFAFMFLEALHMYSYVAFVIKQDGLCSRLQNMVVGWGMAALVVMLCVGFQYESYAASYHCWVDIDSQLLYGQLIPILILVILTFSLIEAAGVADYKGIKGIDKGQLMSAKFSQRTNLVIMPLVFSHMLVGMFAEHEQNLYLYSIFTILNAVTGVTVLFLHCANNQQVRMKMMGIYRSMCKRGGAR